MLEQDEVQAEEGEVQEVEGAFYYILYLDEGIHREDIQEV